MRFEDLNWMDVERYLEKDDRVILVTGATEQHGYLSLATDVRIPVALADAASQQTGVLVAPPLNFGCSPYFLSYPGTISLRVSTLLDVVEDVVRSLYGYGFRRITVLNGHSGNMGAETKLVELTNALPGLQTAWYSWWLSHSYDALAQKYQLKGYHASWMENFPFTQVTDLPEGEKLPVSVHGVLGAEATRAAYGDGSFGGFYSMDTPIMEELFQSCLEDVLHLLG
jgi:creatinine amidohydrolase